MHFRRFVFCIILAHLGACTPKKSEVPSVQVLTYSSLGSKGGFLDSIRESFQRDTGCELRVETTLGATQILSYLEEEKQRARIDWVMGVDELIFERARPFLYLAPDAQKRAYLPMIQKRVQPGFYPLDYGALTFIYRKADFKNGAPLKSIKDLLKPDLQKKFILQDPRASSPGLLFFLFSEPYVSVKQLRKHWATLAPSWDASYKMFLASDASMVWSYLTSLAYHASKGDADQYGFIDFEEGLPIQIEGMSMVNRVGDPLKSNPCNAQFLDFIYRPEVQSLLVKKQWMMPVIDGVVMDSVFKTVPAVKRAADLTLTIEKADRLMGRFGREVRGDDF